MSKFIIDECARFAKIIRANVGQYENLIDLKERFEKQISAYKSENSRELFLKNLKPELDKQFKAHLNSCNKPDCSQHKTYRNIIFLISEELNSRKLSSFLIDNPEYYLLLQRYQSKLVVTSSFLDKEKFIEQEIERINSIFIHPKIEIKSISGAKIISSFDYAQYSKLAYDWLMAGQDFSIGQIINNAKSNYEYEFNNSYEEKEFEKAIELNLQRGVAYILYEKFLSAELSTKNAVRRAKKRTSIPNKIRALLQKEINSYCPFCSSQDVDHFEIHHIDENRVNNDFDNLIMICPTCHSKITKGDISMESVIQKKLLLNR